MKKVFLLFFLVSLLISCKSDPYRNILITETEHQGIPHFQVQTPSATYLINKESGGASSIIDRDGVDWIAHSKNFEGKTTNSADSEWRGLPNLVFRGEDDGVGHPVGRELCSTIQSGPNQLLVTSNSGKWEFSWHFEESYAIISVNKTDPDRKYWFLYEGPVAGNFHPPTHYWANDADGLRFDQPNIRGERVSGHWQWAYFGDVNYDRCFFVSMVENDSLADFFAYMGNIHQEGLQSKDGMNVFGFGRSANVEPLMNTTNTFVFGFYDEKLDIQEGYSKFRIFIGELISKYRLKE